MPLAAPSAPAVGTVLDGKYRVERVLGEGGMGLVVAARHVQLDQLFALKLLLPQYCEHEEAVQRFLREARSAARIQSEHVARVSDVGTLGDGVPFMVMELLEGRDLDRELQARGPLPIAEAAGYVIQACLAVAEAHAFGIVHRDLKPANLFLTRRRDGSFLVKVLDFGISKAIEPDAVGGADANLTSTAAVMGSPQYMSPEQIRSSKHVDARSDVWSLGTVLYELLTGEPAFKADNAPATLAKIVADEVPPPSRSRPDLPAGLEAVVLRCLEKNRDQRFQSVAELASALQPFAGVTAAPSQPLPALGESTREPASGSKTQASWMVAGRFRKSRVWPWALGLVTAGSLVLLGLFSSDEAPEAKPLATPLEAAHPKPSIASAAMTPSLSGLGASVGARSEPSEDAGSSALEAVVDAPVKRPVKEHSTEPRRASPAPAPKPKRTPRPSKGRDLFADPK